MGRRKTTHAWIRGHLNDPYVQQAQRQGYRSRAAFKLLEIADSDRLFRRGMQVIDLGAAPGGWSQVAARRVGPEGRVVALDIAEMAPLPGVVFVQGDMELDATVETLLRALGTAMADLVISDVAPHLSGVAAADQARSVRLAEAAVDLATRLLKPDGVFLVKMFQGSGFPEYLALLRRRFARVVTRKPKASRDRSREIYLLARGVVPEDSGVVPDQGLG